MVLLVRLEDAPSQSNGQSVAALMDNFLHPVLKMSLLAGRGVRAVAPSPSTIKSLYKREQG